MPLCSVAMCDHVCDSVFGCDLVCTSVELLDISYLIKIVIGIKR